MPEISKKRALRRAFLYNPYDLLVKQDIPLIYYPIVMIMAKKPIPKITVLRNAVKIIGQSVAFIFPAAYYIRYMRRATMSENVIHPAFA